MRVGFETLAGLAGLGDCVEFDSDGNCLVDDSSTNTSSSTNANPDCAWGGVYPNCNPNPIQSTTSVASPASVPAGWGTPPASGPGSLLAPLTQAAAAILSRTANAAPVWVTNPTTGQSVLYNPNTGQFNQPAGQGITNPTLQSLTSYIPMFLIAGVAIAVLGNRGGR